MRYQSEKGAEQTPEGKGTSRYGEQKKRVTIHSRGQEQKNCPVERRRAIGSVAEENLPIRIIA